MRKFTYVFICPECSKLFRTDEPGEPCCTGPSETLDIHPMRVMRLLRMENKEVHPVLAAQRAAGKLLLPHDTEAIQREAKLILHG